MLKHLVGACALVHVLLDQASLGLVAVEPEHGERRRRKALEMLASASLPSAVFELPTRDQPLRAAELVNQRWQAMFAGSDVTQALAPHVAEVVRTDAPVYVPELEVRIGTHHHHCAVLLEPRVDASGAFAGVIAVCAELAEHAAEDIGVEPETLAWLAHELRAPLTTMLLWEQVLRGDPTDAELRQLALDAIHQSATQQARLVGDLLDVARAIRGTLRVDLRPVDITRILEEALAPIGSALQAKGITLERQFEPVIGLVQGDAVRLRQVFDNLLANALAAGEAGGRVDVSLRRTGESIAITVADTGRGIPGELVPQLFELGHGALGLAIAHHLVVLHHGTLRAESAGRGRGATFTVTLPGSVS